jgi:hypothetical protein
VANITKHHSEEKGEGDYGEDGRIHFLVHWDAVGIDYLLKGRSELVDLYVCRWLKCVILVPLEVG